MTRPSTFALPFGAHAADKAAPHLSVVPTATPAYVAQLRFALPRATSVIALVFDAEGQIVRSLCEGEKPAGEHLCGWDGLDAAGRRLAPGAYRLTLEADGRTLVARVVTLR